MPERIVCSKCGAWLTRAEEAQGEPWLCLACLRLACGVHHSQQEKAQPEWARPEGKRL
jgi:hypothetical protein